MSVTTVLIPVPEQIAEALVAGGPQAATAASSLIAEAIPLRRLVSSVDAIREELHACLFPRWKAGRPPAAAWLKAVISLFRRQRPLLDADGYDPFVHLFGRSLPIDGPTPRDVATALRSLLADPPERGLATIAATIERLDRRAAEILRQQELVQGSARLEEQLKAMAQEVAVAEDSHSALQRSVGRLALLLSLTQPLWRLDGQSLPALLSAVGMEEPPGSPAPLYEELAAARPVLGPLLTELLPTLVAHEGTGAFLSSSDVTRCLGAIRLRRTTVMTNAADAAAPLIVLRHLRLLEEALSYCELTGMGLLEAAGVESAPALASD